MNLQTQFKQLPRINAPSYLHEKIMNRAASYEYKKRVLILGAFFFLLSIISGWQTTAQISRTEALPLSALIWEQNGLSFATLSSSLSLQLEIFPVKTAALFLINLIFLTGIFYLFTHQNKTFLKIISFRHFK